MITIALPKGRLMQESLSLLSSKGLSINRSEESRKLFFYDKEKRCRFLIVRAQDVATYVEHSAADLGIVGLDTLKEQQRDVFELADLGIGYCRMVVAGKDATCMDEKKKQLKVATKFVNIAQSHFLSKGINAEIIKLYGSIELAPLLGIADCIVDIVSTGRTLKENGLSIIEEIFESTAMLIANKSSYYTRFDEIKWLFGKIKDETAHRSA